MAGFGGLSFGSMGLGGLGFGDVGGGVFACVLVGFLVVCVLCILDIAFPFRRFGALLFGIRSLRILKGFLGGGPGSAKFLFGVLVGLRAWLALHSS